MSATRTARPSNRRAARQHAREAQRTRDIRRRQLRWIMAGIGALAVVAALALFLVQAARAQPGKPVANQGQTHISQGTAHVAYNSKPPTSGPHWNLPGEAPRPWGIYKEPIPDESQIHNIEHGGVMIQYNCRDCPELVEQLESFYERFTAANKIPMFPNSSKIIVAPYYDMPTRIALTAWNRIDTFDTYDEQRMIKFIDAFRNHGPEAAP